MKWPAKCFGRSGLEERCVEVWLWKRGWEGDAGGDAGCFRGHGSGDCEIGDVDRTRWGSGEDILSCEFDWSYSMLASRTVSSLDEQAVIDIGKTVCPLFLIWLKYPSERRTVD